MTDNPSEGTLRIAFSSSTSGGLERIRARQPGIVHQAEELRAIHGDPIPQPIPALPNDLTRFVVELPGGARYHCRVVEVELGPDPSADTWTFPVYPPEDWYCSVRHSLDGSLNADGYAHSGVDLNGDWGGRGDVDRGQPVLAITEGVVSSVGRGDETWLGVVVVEHRHEGAPLYVRYAHLDKARMTVAAAGMPVLAGDCLGYLGDYTRGDGGDHLHFDMCLDEFRWSWWHTRHPELRWIDPVPVLKAHLFPARVDAMLRGRPGMFCAYPELM